MAVSFSYNISAAGVATPVSTTTTTASLAGAAAERDFALGPDGDLLLVNGDFVMLTGDAAVASDIAATLQVFTGEYFLDVTLGIPREILGSKFDKGRLEAIYREQIRSRPGVASTRSLLVDFVGRTVTIRFGVITDFGSLIEGTLTDTGG